MKIWKLLRWHEIQQKHIDETALLNVHRLPKVIATKKQVRQITPGEKENMVTLIGAVNAVGNTIPLLLVL